MRKIDRELWPGRASLLVLLLLAAPAAAADCSAEADVAVRFMNQYLAYSQAAEQQPRQSTEKWLKSNTLLTPGFAARYKAKTAEGLRRDRELGWDEDIILDAQDFPDKGFQFSSCGAAAGFVQLQGVDWAEFKVTVKVITTPRGLRVDGAGMVNIPGSERASR